MKNNVAVFILIILVASSFKYRSKTSGISLAGDTDRPASGSSVESKPVAGFRDFTDKMQEANRELANGNRVLVKELWSHADDVSIFCSSSGVEVKGWHAVEERLDWICSQITPGSKYDFEKISAQSGENFGSLQQTEHYRLPDGKTMDLGVTILFKKEADGWRIIHRHAENLTPRLANM